MGVSRQDKISGSSTYRADQPRQSSLWTPLEALSPAANIKSGLEATGTHWVAILGHGSSQVLSMGGSPEAWLGCTKAHLDSRRLAEEVMGSGPWLG